MKALIGLTSGDETSKGTILNKLNYTYIKAIESSGGVPIIIPNLNNMENIEKILEGLDGLVFTGGEDISPLLFKEEPIRETRNIAYRRDRMEMELFKAAYKKRIPILGICRGIQVINVALGGDLYQDIPSQIEGSHGHMSSYDIEGGYHSLTILKKTKLFHIFKEEKIIVNSQHHQSVKNLGKDLKINSIAPDGVIEGIESTTDKNFLLGLQFHPEAMSFRDENFLNIFSYFIDNCYK